VDTRSDVYALGVIAYQLLAGRMPYDLGERALAEAVRVIQEDEPGRLSGISRVYPGDIETIVGKALSKEKERRYASAHDLATDIRRYLTDEPLSREAVDRAARRPAMGPGHPTTRAMAGLRARIVEALGRADEAAAVRKQFNVPPPATSPGTPATTGPATTLPAQ
jgi:serine/threonine protein kinase